MFIIKDGNILEAPENIICHQVNCFAMGSGLAAQLMDKWPPVSSTHKELCDNAARVGERHRLLGCIQFVPVEQDKLVANLFGQLNFGYDKKRYTDYTALRSAFRTLRKEIETNPNLRNYSIAIPYGIGCGLGGGDWFIVLGIIEDELGDCNVTLYRYGEHKIGK